MSYILKYEGRPIEFIKCRDIMVSPEFHFKYTNQISVQNTIDNLVDKERLINKYTELANPRYLCMSLYCYNTVPRFAIYNQSPAFRWFFDKSAIYNASTNTYLAVKSNVLITTLNKTEWIINETIRHKETGLYITCNERYQLLLTPHKTTAIKFHIEDCLIHYMKTPLQVSFEINNYKNGISVSRFLNALRMDDSKQPFNVGVLLAAGTSSRFHSEKHKQLYYLGGLRVLQHSLNTMIGTRAVDRIIIVTNDECFEEIREILRQYKNVALLKNNVNCRLETMRVALDYIQRQHPATTNVIFHDSARPHIKPNHITDLIALNEIHTYSQYCIKLVNGLIKNKDEFVDREDYLEACTPICMNFYACNFVFKNYMQKSNRIVHEFIPILKILNLSYHLAVGDKADLQKITTIDDV